MHFFQDHPYATIRTYFHEIVHSLGIVKNEYFFDRFRSKVGYSERVISYDGDVYSERGEFLEESVVDFLAAEMAAEYISLSNEPIKPRDLLMLIDNEGFAHVRDALRTIMVPHPELQELIIRGRFEPGLEPDLERKMTEIYGVGSFEELISTPFDSDAIYSTTLSITKAIR